MVTPLKKNRGWMILVPLFLLGVCLLVAIGIVHAMDHPQNSIDFSNFWLAGHLVTQGKSPYDASLWIAEYPPYMLDIALNPSFVYPLPLALLFAPLGRLPFHLAYLAWVTLLLLMIVSSLPMLLALAAPARSRLILLPLLAGISLFRPTTLTLTQGQVSGLFLCFLTGMAVLWSKARWFWGGCLLGMLMLKPNLGVIVIALLGIWLLLHRRWTALAGIAAACIFLLLAGLAYSPQWISEYWHLGSSYLTLTFGGAPTLWGLGALVCHRRMACTLSFGGLTCLLVLLGFLWMMVRRKDLTVGVVLALAVTVTLLVAPYTWTYDQLLLLIPITLVTLTIDHRGARPLVSGVIFLAIDGLAVVLLIFDVLLKVEILNVIVPLVVFALEVRYLLQPAV